MKRIEFSKLTGQGNDFILIDSTKEDIIFESKQIRMLCDRHFGIGADGVILVKKSDLADLFMDYYNSDGSMAEMCGNGIRCMAKYAFDKNITKKKEIIIETRAGLKKVKLYIKKTKEIDLIEVNMGKPILDAVVIPIDLKAAEEINNHFNLKDDKFFNQTFKILDKEYEFNCLSMGNPHCVILLKEKEDLKDIDILKLGPLIENHPIFPKKTNVEFVKIDNEHEISVIVWERGCGETLACGTGACASVAASILLNKVKPGVVIVNLKGGILFIDWTGEKQDSIFLKGTVKHIFDGEYFL